MAQFSIRQGVKSSLLGYARHVLLLLGASVILGGSLWLTHKAPCFVAKKLGVEKTENMAIDIDLQTPGIQATEQSSMALRKVQELTVKLSHHLNSAPAHILFVIWLTWFFMWVFHLLVLFGFIKLCLALRDKDKGSIELMFQTSARQLMRFVVTYVIFVLYAACGIIGISILTIPFFMVSQSFCPDQDMVIAKIMWLVFMVALLAWLARYVLFGFCLADKPTLGAREALTMSREITRGSRLRLIMALAAGCVMSALVCLVVCKVYGLVSMNDMMEMMSCKKSLAHLLCKILVAPFWGLYLAYLYRSLNKK